MLRATIVVLATTLVFGGSALSSSAFARGRGDGDSVAGGGFRGGHSAGVFGGGRTIGESYRGYGGRVSGLRGGSPARDMWGHWRAYYGPMISNP
jgi:hypothetical protein